MAWPQPRPGVGQQAQPQQPQAPAKPVFTGSPTPQVGTISVPPVTLIGRIAEVLGASGGGGGGGGVPGMSGGEDTAGVTSSSPATVQPSGGMGSQVGFSGAEGGAQALPLFDSGQQGGPSPGGQGFGAQPSTAFDGMGAVADWARKAAGFLGGGGGMGGGAQPGSVGGFAGPPVNMDPGNQGNSSTIMDTLKVAMKVASMAAGGGGG